MLEESGVPAVDGFIGGEPFQHADATIAELKERDEGSDGADHKDATAEVNVLMSLVAVSRSHEEED